MTDERLAQYIEDDAERWFAVHQRIRGLTVLLMAVTDAAIERDPVVRERVIVRIQEVVKMYAADQVHPALMSELREFLEGLEGDDPTKRSMRPE